MQMTPSTKVRYRYVICRWHLIEMLYIGVLYADYT